MSDWIEQLERLTRLHRDGALTDAEFAEQKARLLAAQQAPAPEPEPEFVAEADHEADAAPSRKGLLIGGAIAALTVLGAAGWYGSQAVPDSELTQPAAVATPSAVAAAEPSLAATEAPMPVALDETLAFSSPSTCGAGDTLERVYKKLEAGMNLGSGRGLTVALDGFEVQLQIAAKSGKDKDGADTASADLRFPAETTWHGLKISRVTTSRYYPPETDGMDKRTINFLEPPEKVRRTLGRLGFNVPEEPDYKPIEEAQGCGGAMQIEKLSGGSALVCTWGC